MAQVWSPKFLFFCFFSGATAENVYPKLCIPTECACSARQKNVPVLGTNKLHGRLFLDGKFFYLFYYECLCYNCY